MLSIMRRVSVMTEDGGDAVLVRQRGGEAVLVGVLVRPQQQRPRLKAVVEGAAVRFAGHVDVVLHVVFGEADDLELRLVGVGDRDRHSVADLHAGELRELFGDDDLARAGYGTVSPPRCRSMMSVIAGSSEATK